MGMAGPEARARAQEIITSDPRWQGQLQLGLQGADRSMAARGMGNSGAAHLAAQRVMNEQYDNVLNRYAGLSDRGYQSRMGGVGLAGQNMQNKASLEQGTMANAAGIATDTGNALAANRNTFGNNIGQLVGLGLKGASLFMGGK